jgi:hypothetical protein
MSVAFTSSNGLTVMVEKHKRRRYIDDSDRDKACLEIIQRLKEAGVKQSTANLLRCGIGAQTLYAYKLRTGSLKYKRQKNNIAAIEK